MEPAFELSSVPYGPAMGVALILLTNLTQRHTYTHTQLSHTHIPASDKYERIWASHCANVRHSFAKVSSYSNENVKQTFGDISFRVCICKFYKFECELSFGP